MSARRRSSASRAVIPRALRARLARVQLLLCDVDGVLTPGTVVMGQGGEFKEFNIQDGLGLRLLQRHGVRVGWVSARPSTATEQRARDLKVDFLHQALGRKSEAVEGILQKAQVAWEQVCFIGDDLVDLGVLRRAGLGVAVANAVPEAKSLAHYVTRAEGGRGAVREVVDLILRAQGRWVKLVEDFAE